MGSVFRYPNIGEINMTEIVVVYQDGEEYYFKPMGTKKVSKKVIEELAKHESDKFPYNIARAGTLTVNEDETPNDEGYYIKSQASFELNEDGEFVKQFKDKFRDCKTNKEVKLTEAVNIIEAVK